MPYLAFHAMTQYYLVHMRSLFLLADYLYRPIHPFSVEVVKVHQSSHLHSMIGAKYGFDQRVCFNLSLHQSSLEAFCLGIYLLV